MVDQTEKRNRDVTVRLTELEKRVCVRESNRTGKSLSVVILDLGREGIERLVREERRERNGAERN